MVTRLWGHERQADVAREGAYLPLSATTIGEQERRLAIGFVDGLAPYRPAEKVSGTVTLWGHGSFKRDFMGKPRMKSCRPI